MAGGGSDGALRAPETTARAARATIAGPAGSAAEATWQALSVAPRLGPGSPTAIVARDPVPDRPLPTDRLRRLGYGVSEINGPDVRGWVGSLGEAREVRDRPTALVARGFHEALADSIRGGASDPGGAPAPSGRTGPTGGRP
jgi:hypothetical protein